MFHNWLDHRRDLLGFVMFECSGWWISGSCPFRHPHIRNPFCLARKEFLKYFTVEVCLFCGWGVEGIGLWGSLHLTIIDLQQTTNLLNFVFWLGWFWHWYWAVSETFNKSNNIYTSVIFSNAPINVYQIPGGKYTGESYRADFGCQDPHHPTHVIVYIASKYYYYNILNGRNKPLWVCLRAIPPKM